MPFYGAKDWHRNSVQMYAQSIFSHRELHGKGLSQIHDSLHHLGKSWEKDLTYIERNGTFILNNENGYELRHDILPNYSDINAIIEPLIRVPNYGRT